MTITQNQIRYNVLPQYEGHLVNFVNAFDMHSMYQVHTSLLPDATKMHLVSSLSKATVLGQNGGKEITSLSSFDLTKYQGHSIHLDTRGQQVEQHRDDAYFTAQAEFDAGADDDYEAAEEDDQQGLEEGLVDIIEQPQIIVQQAAITAGHTFSNSDNGTSPELDSLAELYTMLDKRGCANSLFDKITTWAWLNAHTFGRAPPMKRDVVVQKVFKEVRGENYKDFLSPRQKVLQLSTGRHVAITYFPLENMILDLLCNTALMEKENLLFSNFNDPRDDDTTSLVLGEVNSGSWWKTAKEHECKGPSDILWPLIMFIDGMKVDYMSGKLKLEPISFTFSRFQRWVRHQDNAWRTWAYMPHSTYVGWRMT